eukprot:3643673-Prymnesium_polylepis.1
MELSMRGDELCMYRKTNRALRARKSASVFTANLVSACFCPPAVRRGMPNPAAPGGAWLAFSTAGAAALEHTPVDGQAAKDVVHYIQRAADKALLTGGVVLALVLTDADSGSDGVQNRFQVPASDQGGAPPSHALYFCLWTSCQTFVELVARRISPLSAFMNGTLLVKDRDGVNIPLSEQLLGLARTLDDIVGAATDVFVMETTGMCWEASSSLLSYRGLHARKSHMLGYGAALGAPVLRSGAHRLTFAISRSASNDGAGICIGVASADASLDAPPFLTVLSDRLGRRPAEVPTSCAAWGIEPASGRLWTSCGPLLWGTRGKRLTPDGQSVARAAEGARIHVLVDMDSRTLSFQLNELPRFEAEIRLPEAVRPWVMLGWAGDSVRLVEYLRDGGDTAAET